MGATNVTDLYVGPLHVTREGLTPFIAQGTQPATISFGWRAPPQMGENFTAYRQRVGDATTPVTAPRRTDTPLLFDTVAATGGK